MTRTLVTGASGMLGNDLCPALLKGGFQVYPTDLAPDSKSIDALDVREKEKVNDYIKKVNPSLIIHLAAETDVDKCEIDRKHASLTNTEATANIAIACKALGIPLVFISTGAVFDGKSKDIFRETDKPNPVNFYGKTKVEAEQMIEKALTNYFIFRAGWMIGGGKKDKKFVGKIVNILKDKNDISAVIDKKGTPTFTEDFSANLLRVIKTGHYGTFHMANQGVCTRFDIALKIVEYIGKKGVTVKPVTSDAFPLPAPRGDSEALENYKLKLLGLDHMPRWEDSLKKYVGKILE